MKVKIKTYKKYQPDDKNGSNQSQKKKLFLLLFKIVTSLKNMKVECIAWIDLQLTVCVCVCEIGGGVKSKHS